MILTNATYLTPAYKFEKKDLYITNGQIYTEKPDKNEHEVMDCEDYIVIPGLVNAHFHSYSPLAKGLMKDMALEDWADTSVQGIFQQAFFTYVDEKMTENDLWSLSQKSYIDMVRGGITFVLEALFVDPFFIGKGVGKVLWKHLIGQAMAHNIAYFDIESDPEAEGFYQLMGAKRIGQVTSSVFEDRQLPLLRMILE